MDPIDRQLRELTRDRTRLSEELDEIAGPRGEMDVWGADEDEDETEDADG